MAHGFVGVWLTWRHLAHCLRPKRRRVVDGLQASVQISRVCIYPDQHSGSIVHFTAIRLDKERQTADIRDFEGAGASGSGASAWARRRNTCLAMVGRRIANTVGPQRTRRSKTCLRTRVNSSALFRYAARPCWTWTYQGRVNADVSELSFDSRTSTVQSSRSLQNEIMYLEVEGNHVLMRESCRWRWR
jgi:hypothetical protein